jgi:LAO/AO transport system kinase
VLPTVATKGEGIGDVVDAIEGHRVFLQSTGALRVRERARVESQMQELLQAALMQRFQASSKGDLYPVLVERVLNRELAPRQALLQMLDEAEG